MAFVKRPHNFRDRLAIITICGAVVRLALLIHRWNRGLKLNDSLWYAAAARGLRNGQFFHALLDGTPTAEHPPLTPMLMAPVSFLPAPVQGQRLTTTLFGIALGALVGVLGKKLFDERVGLIAAIIAAVYPNMFVHDGVVMSGSIALVLVVVWMLALIRLLDGPTLRRAALVGLTAGLAALTRSELLLVCFASMIATLWHRRDRATWLRAGVIGAATLATILPWTIANLGRFERPVFLSTNDGTTLLGSYCDLGFNGENKGGWSLLCVLDDQGTDDASIRSERQRRQAMVYAYHHKRQLPGVMLARFGRMVDLYGVRDMVQGDFGEDQERPLAWAGVFCWFVLAPLAAFGVVGSRRRTLGILMTPVAIVLITTFVFYGSHRLRVPMEPTVVLLAAVTIGRLLRRRTAADEATGGAGDLVLPTP